MQVRTICKTNHRGTEAQRKPDRNEFKNLATEIKKKNLFIRIKTLCALWQDNLLSVPLCLCGNIAHRNVGRTRKI